MKKMIIFCEHAVETLTYFSRQLAESFEAWGYESFWMDFEMLGLSVWKLRQAMADQHEQIQAALITFNFIGLSAEDQLWDFDEEGIPCGNIWEKLGIQCLNIMVDHPIYYYKALLHPVRGMQTFCIDKDHAAYMKRFYPDIPCEFLPLAGNRLLQGRDDGKNHETEQPSAENRLLQGRDDGKNHETEQPSAKNRLLQGRDDGKNHETEQPSAENRLLQGRHHEKNSETEQWLTGSQECRENQLSAKHPQNYREMLSSCETYEQWLTRPYHLVFTANYVPISSIEHQLQQLEPEYRDFYYEMIDAFIQNPSQDLLSGMEQYMRREMPDLSDAELCEAMSTTPAVDLWVRTYFREQTVRTLAEGGVPVYLFGKDWDQMPCKNPENMICSGRMVNSADCVHAMASAKIALNTMPWFKDGAHDRIFTAMLHQAASLTDDSAYLRSRYTDRDTILYYSLTALNELPGLVQDILQQPEKLYTLASRAMTAALRHHTWHQRAGMLRQYLP